MGVIDYVPVLTKFINLGPPVGQFFEVRKR